MNNRRRARVVLAVLVLVSLVLVTVDFRSDEGPVDGLRGVAANLFGPLQRGASTLAAPVVAFVGRIGDLGSTFEENERLRAQVEALRERRRGTRELERENAELRGLLDVADASEWDGVAARTVAVSPSNFEWTATIDVGTDDGVAEDMPVVNGDGLVGRVVLADRRSSRVLLTIDPSFGAAARLGEGGETGTVAGRGSRLLLLELVDPEVDVAAGDEVVTSAYDFGVYPAGIPVGVVEDVPSVEGELTREVEVRPYVDFTALADVLVLRTEQVPRPADVPDQPTRDLDPPQLVPSPSPSGGGGNGGGGGSGQGGDT